MPETPLPERMDADLALCLCPILETERLVLEPLGERHADAFFEALQDDALYQWISMNKPASLQWLRDHWRGIESRLAPDHLRAWPTWALRRKSDGLCLGRVDAEITPALQASVGYYLFPAHWGQGYAIEAVRTVTQHFLSQGVRRLAATVTVGNIASERVLQKAGYSFSRVLVGNDIIRGVAMDDVEYILSAP